MEDGEHRNLPLQGPGGAPAANAFFGEFLAAKNTSAISKINNFIV